METSGNSKSKYSPFGQKTLKIGTFSIVILCHRNCHTGTGTSLGVLKMKTHVWRTHTQFLHALDWPHLSSEGQDMIICSNVALMLYWCQKGLVRYTTLLCYFHGNPPIIYPKHHTHDISGQQVRVKSRDDEDNGQARPLPSCYGRLPPPHCSVDTIGLSQNPWG